MVGIKRIFSAGRKSTNVTVVLSDNRLAVVPRPVSLQTVYSDEEIALHENREGLRSWVHVSFLPKPVKRDRAPESEMCRSWEGYDASDELELITSCILKLYPTVIGRWRSSDHVEDLAQECFMALWEKQIYRRFYDGDNNNYVAYVKTAVKHFLIDTLRSSSNQIDSNKISLNAPVSTSEDGGVELQDFLVDQSNNVAEFVERDALMDRFSAVIVDLDAAQPTGLSNLSYRQIFDYLLSGSVVEDIRCRTKYSAKTISFHVDKLRSRLAAAC